MLSSKTWWIVVAMTIILFTFTFIHKYSSYHVCSYLFSLWTERPFFIFACYFSPSHWLMMQSFNKSKRKEILCFVKGTSSLFLILFSQVDCAFPLIELNLMEINLWVEFISLNRFECLYIQMIPFITFKGALQVWL